MLEVLQTLQTAQIKAHLTRWKWTMARAQYQEAKVEA